MPDRFSRRILDHVTHRHYEPRQIHDLARELGIGKQQYDQFCQSVETLIDRGEVILGSSDTIVLPPPGPEMVGAFRLNERGFGFIVPDRPSEHGDLFVPPGNTAGAMTGDFVRARVVHRAARASTGPRREQRSPYIGKVVEIIRRADRQYVGALVKRGPDWVVHIDAGIIHHPVLIGDPHVKGARSGSKVVIELVKYPTDQEAAEGVITEVLGKQGQPDVETVAVMRAFGLEEPFPEDVVREARDVADAFDDSDIPADRQDLTSRLVVTIDPPNARDFDDGISIQQFDPADAIADGAVYELGIHIADVSHFVRSGSRLDQEARARGNSTYLPRRVLPMLPELLSNGVCSLQSGVIRLCKSVFVRYDSDANVVGRRFSRAVIRSSRRLTYLEAQALINGDRRAAARHAQSRQPYPAGVVDQLQLMNDLAQRIRQRRLAAGMIELDLPEVQLVFDDAGRVTDAMPEDDAFTHKMIEMFMVEANEAAAALFDALDVPMIRRTHPDPIAHDVKQLRQFARVAGYNIPARPTRQELQGLLNAVRGKPAQTAVHLAVLQTLSRAEYAPLLIGHFALASEHYTHFTSPIRRYPDLVVHHGLDAYFDAHLEHARRFLPSGRGRKAVSRSIRESLHDATALAELGRHCSATERNSEAAERNLRNFLVLDLLGKHLGEDFDGTVTGITGSGIYVQIDRFLVDGFIRVSDLPGSKTGHGERWQLNRMTGALVAQRSAKTITIGDRFVVRVANVDPPGRRLELVIMPESSAKLKKRRQTRGTRKGMQRAQPLKQVKKQDCRQSCHDGN